MSKEIREYLKTSRPYVCALIGGVIGAIFGSVTNNWLALLFGQFFGAIIAVLLAKPKGYVLSGCLGSFSALLADLLVQKRINDARAQIDRACMQVEPGARRWCISGTW